MGVFDFVKQGVQEMMIARPDHLKSLIVYKHPDQNVPWYSQLTVDSDECAVFFKDGRVMGVLPPGRHTLHTQNIPFLNQLVTSYTGGNVFISEIFFVKTTAMKTFPPVKLDTSALRNGMFCVSSVTRPGGRTPTTRPSRKNTAHSSLSTVSCECIGTF